MSKKLFAFIILALITAGYGVGSFCQDNATYNTSVANTEQIIKSRNLTIIEAAIQDPQIVIAENTILELIKQNEQLNQTTIYKSGLSTYYVLTEQVAYQYSVSRETFGFVFIIMGTMGASGGFMFWNFTVSPSNSKDETQGASE